MDYLAVMHFKKRESRAAADENHYKRGTSHIKKSVNAWDRPSLAPCQKHSQTYASSVT